MWETAPSEVIFHEFDFERGLEINNPKAHNFVWQWCFFYVIVISHLRWPIEFKFSQVCYFMQMLGYTKCEKTGLWQLPRVSSVICNELQYWNKCSWMNEWMNIIIQLIHETFLIPPNHTCMALKQLSASRIPPSCSMMPLVSGATETPGYLRHISDDVNAVYLWFMLSSAPLTLLRLL